MKKNKKILMVVTSHNRLGNLNRKTGVWLEELALPYMAFTEAGYDVVVASPEGGTIPLDPDSLTPDAANASSLAFLYARPWIFEHAVPLEKIDPEEFDAIFYPGGHGPLWDLPDNAGNARLIERFIAEDKPVSAVCHGIAGLLSAKNAFGAPVVAGRRVTAFSDEEESIVDLQYIVPFSLEQRLRSEGAEFRKDAPWQNHIEIDDRLVTGQNPQSAEAAAIAVINLLK